MWLLGFLFAFSVGTLWWISKDTKEICEDLSYLIELLEQNPDLVKKSTDQTQSNINGGDSMGSRRELYK